MTIRIKPNTNNTAATINWTPQQDVYAGFDTITKYTF